MKEEIKIYDEKKSIPIIDERGNVSYNTGSHKEYLGSTA